MKTEKHNSSVLAFAKIQISSFKRKLFQQGVIYIVRPWFGSMYHARVRGGGRSLGGLENLKYLNSHSKVPKNRDSEPKKHQSEENSGSAPNFNLY